MSGPLVGLGAASTWRVVAPDDEILACAAAPQFDDSPLVALVSSQRVLVWAVSTHGCAEIGSISWPPSDLVFAGKTARVCWDSSRSTIGATRQSASAGGSCLAATFVIEQARGTVLEASRPLDHGSWGLIAAAPIARFDDAAPIGNVSLRQTGQTLTRRLAGLTGVSARGSLSLVDRAGRLVDIGDSLEDGDIAEAECLSIGDVGVALVGRRKNHSMFCKRVAFSDREDSLVLEMSRQEGQITAFAAVPRRKEKFQVAVASAGGIIVVHTLSAAAGIALLSSRRVVSTAGSFLAWAPGDFECLAVASETRCGVWDARERLLMRNQESSEDRIRGVAWVLGGSRLVCAGRRVIDVVPLARVHRSSTRGGESGYGRHRQEPLSNTSDVVVGGTLCAADRVLIFRKWRWEPVALPVALARAPPARLAIVSPCGECVAVGAAKGFAVVRIDKRDTVELEVTRRAIDAIWCSGEVLVALYEREDEEFFLEDSASLRVYSKKKKRRHRFFEAVDLLAFDGVIDLSSLKVKRFLDAVQVDDAKWRIVVAQANGLVSIVQLSLLQTAVGLQAVFTVLEHHSCSPGASVDSAFYSPSQNLLVVLGDDDDHSGVVAVRGRDKTAHSWIKIGTNVRAIFCRDFHENDVDETVVVAHGGRQAGRGALRDSEAPFWIWSSILPPQTPSDDEEETKEEEEDAGSRLRYCLAASPRLEGVLVLDVVASTEQLSEPPSLTASVVPGCAEAMLRLLLRLGAASHAKKLEPFLESAREPPVESGLIASWRRRRRVAAAEFEVAKTSVRFLSTAWVRRARNVAPTRWDRPWVVRALSQLLRESTSNRAEDFLVTRAALSLSFLLGPSSLLAIVAAAGRHMDEDQLGRLFWRGPRLCSLRPARLLFADALRIGDRRTASRLVSVVADDDPCCIDHRITQLSRVLLKECFVATLQGDDDIRLLKEVWIFSRRAEDAAQAAKRAHKFPSSLSSSQGKKALAILDESRSTDELAATFALNTLIKRPTPHAVKIVAETLFHLNWRPPPSWSIGIDYDVSKSVDIVVDSVLGAFPDLFRRDLENDEIHPGAAADRLLVVVTAFKLPDWRMLLELGVSGKVESSSLSEDHRALLTKLETSLLTRHRADIHPRYFVGEEEKPYE